MSEVLSAAIFATTVLVGTFVFLEIGLRVGLRHVARYGEKTHTGFGTVEGAIFGLLGLLIAFSFSGAMARFDQRRHLIVAESNAIGTAWLRLDLLPPATQPELRDLFRRYLDTHLAFYRRLPDLAAAQAERDEGVRLEGEIWKRASAAASQSEHPQTVMLVVEALNTMIDVANTETMARKIHPPEIIFIMLVILAVSSSFLAGYAMAGSKSRHWVHSISFALIVAMTVYIILDIEHPLAGFIRVESITQTLVDLRKSMSGSLRAFLKSLNEAAKANESPDRTNIRE